LIILSILLTLYYVDVSAESTPVKLSQDLSSLFALFRDINIRIGQLPGFPLSRPQQKTKRNKIKIKITQIWGSQSAVFSQIAIKTCDVSYVSSRYVFCAYRHLRPENILDDDAAKHLSDEFVKLFLALLTLKVTLLNSEAAALTGASPEELNT
jgi:hypothetical protein